MLTPGGAPTRVLLVDDDVAEHRLAEILFSHMPPGAYQLRRVSTYEEALRAEPVDVFLVDYDLGAHDGLDLLRELRARGRSEPVILLTGRSDRALDQAAMQDGVADYLVKGRYDEEALDRAIRYAMARHREERAIRALQESEELFHAFMDNSPTVAYLKDEHGRFLYGNALARRVLGEDLAGRMASDVWPSELASLVQARDEEVLRTGTPIEHYLQLRYPDGSPHEWLALRFPVLIGERRMVGVKAIDVTNQRSLEEQLRQSQKMEALGRLAGGVAHDFNNLLTVINGYAELMLYRPDLEEGCGLALREVKQAGERASSLTRQLLAFSRRQIVAPAILDLNGVVGDVEAMLRRLIGEDVELRVRTAESLGTVLADPGQMEQVLLNLAINSRDAMPLGGRLVIATENVDLDGEAAHALGLGAPGRFVALVVTDNGEGMDADTLAHIFEPFFTTKPDGKGTGLGLATVFGIVQAAGGGIQVHSAVGRGTTFRLLFPRVERVEPAARVESERPSGRLGTETVLLVEDEPSVRGLTRAILQRAGYQVLEATSSYDALAICREYEGPIDLLLTDVVMPKLGGRELAEKAVPLRPRMRVLFMSGYTDDAVLRHGVREATHRFVQKPFKPSVLTRYVREVLDATDEPASTPEPCDAAAPEPAPAARED